MTAMKWAVVVLLVVGGLLVLFGLAWAMWRMFLLVWIQLDRRRVVDRRRAAGDVSRYAGFSRLAQDSKGKPGTQ
jgi:hypothetical protein